MALSRSLVHGPYVKGDRREVIVDVTYDAAYVTGGLAIVAADVGLISIHSVEPAVSAAGAVSAYVPATGKMILFTNGSTQATNASDQSAVTVRHIITGK